MIKAQIHTCTRSCAGDWMYKRWLQKPVVLQIHSGCVKIGRCILCSAYYPRLSQVLSFRYAHPETTAISYTYTCSLMRRYLQEHEHMWFPWQSRYFYGFYQVGLYPIIHQCLQNISIIRQNKLQLERDLLLKKSKNKWIIVI